MSHPHLQKNAFGWLHTVVDKVVCTTLKTYAKGNRTFVKPYINRLLSTFGQFEKISDHRTAITSSTSQTPNRGEVTSRLEVTSSTST